MRIFSTLPILLCNTFFEEVSSKQSGRNPDYHPRWKAKKEKRICRKSGTLHGWQEPVLVQPPAETQLHFCQSPSDVLSLHVRSTPLSLTPASIREKATCSRLLLSRVMQRSISLGRLLPMTFSDQQVCCHLIYTALPGHVIHFHKVLGVLHLEVAK